MFFMVSHFKVSRVYNLIFVIIFRSFCLPKTNPKNSRSFAPLLRATLRCSIMPGVKKIAEFMPRRGAQTVLTLYPTDYVLLGCVKWHKK